MEDQQLLTADQLATRLGVSRKAVWEFARSGALPVIRLGPRRLRFDPRDVELWLQRRTTWRPQTAQPYFGERTKKRGRR